MGDIFYQRLTAKLVAEIVPHLGVKPKDENAVLGRALTALYFAAEGGMPIEQSSLYIVDGTGDFGIDGLWHDVRTNRILIASTKFRENQSKGFDQGDIHKFLHGAQKIIDQDVSDANSDLRGAFGKIAPAIKDINTRIILILLTTGRVELPPNCLKLVKDFCDKKNAGLDDTFGYDYVKFDKLFGLAKLYS